MMLCAMPRQKPDTKYSIAFVCAEIGRYPRLPPFPHKTLLVKSGQGLAQRRKAAKVRTGDGGSQQSPTRGEEGRPKPRSLDGRGVWGEGGSVAEYPLRPRTWPPHFGTH